MRRNVTISLDDAFIPAMDKACKARGKARGRWIEGLAKRYAFGFDDLEPSPTKAATVEAERSPDPDREQDQTAVVTGG